MRGWLQAGNFPSIERKGIHMTSQAFDAVPNPLAALSSSLAGIVESVGASTLGVPGRHRRGLAAMLGDASSIKPGHLAIAVGRSAQENPTASYGIVSRASGPWETWLGGQLDRLIRLDGGIHEGLSGAPVADASGAVFGMATAALSRSYGIGAQPVPLANARGPGEPGAGVGLLITALISGGPAIAAGLLVGDILVSIDDTPVASLPDLRVTLAGQIGKAVTVSVLGGGQGHCRGAARR
jgi:S1-C subfamily serine protease